MTLLENSVAEDEDTDAAAEIVALARAVGLKGFSAPAHHDSLGDDLQRLVLGLFHRYNIPEDMRTRVLPLRRGASFEEREKRKVEDDAKTARRASWRPQENDWYSLVLAMAIKGKEPRFAKLLPEYSRQQRSDDLRSERGALMQHFVEGGANQSEAAGATKAFLEVEKMNGRYDYNVPAASYFRTEFSRKRMSAEPGRVSGFLKYHMAVQRLAGTWRDVCARITMRAVG